MLKLHPNQLLSRSSQTLSPAGEYVDQRELAMYWKWAETQISIYINKSVVLFGKGSPPRKFIMTINLHYAEKILVYIIYVIFSCTEPPVRAQLGACQ